MVATVGPAANATPTNATAQVDRLIVGYKPTTAEAKSDAAAAGAVDAKAGNLSVQRRLATGGVVVNLNGQSIEAATAAFRADPAVAFVERDITLYPQAVEPNDPEYQREWHLFEERAGMNVPGAWASTTGANVTVAVIDTGYVTHSDLAPNIIAGYDFASGRTNGDGNGRDADATDPGDSTTAGQCAPDAPKTDSSWHGTHVAGTIAAATNNGKGVAGIAYDSKVQPVRVLGKCGGSLADISDAIVWSSGGTVNGVPANKTPAKVINMSLGGASSCSSTMQSAINGAVQRGTTVVVAAGNSNTDVAGFTPANCNNVIAVAASNRAGDRAFYSNYGAKVDITAPGGQTRNANDPPGTTPENGVWSTLNTGATSAGSENYEPYMGTSMASPHIAGLAALLVGKKNTLTPAEIEKAIKDNARPLPGTCQSCGAGLADATKTVNSLGGQPGEAVSVTNPGNQSTKVGDTVNLQVKAASAENLKLTFATTGLPSGLSIDSASGVVSGKPTTAGTSEVKVTVTDSNGKSNSASFTWTVTSTQGGAVSVTNPGTQMGFTGFAIRALQIRGSSTAGGALTYSATGLPTGLKISTSGSITGTPTKGGNYSVTVTATDAGGNKGTTTFAWKIYGF
ncbi:MAG: S8 family serine peptidase [Actinomycetota bacterium]|nr:S8 family serine peptidase [Actinomycetota bacterium]